MVDPYPIALNGGWSKRYGNAVDENFGCAGCDNCRGTFYDIRDRVKSAKDRLRLTGRGRTSPVWIVPQLFTGKSLSPAFYVRADPRFRQRRRVLVEGSHWRRRRMQRHAGYQSWYHGVLRLELCRYHSRPPQRESPLLGLLERTR